MFVCKVYVKDKKKGGDEAVLDLGKTHNEAADRSSEKEYSTAIIKELRSSHLTGVSTQMKMSPTKIVDFGAQKKLFWGKKASINVWQMLTVIDDGIRDEEMTARQRQ